MIHRRVQAFPNLLRSYHFCSELITASDELSNTQIRELAVLQLCQVCSQKAEELSLSSGAGR